MEHVARSKLRAAEQLYSWLRTRTAPNTTVYLPELSWATLEKLARQIRRAQRHGFSRAANRLTAQLIRELNFFAQRLSSLAAALQAQGQARPLPSSTDIFCQLTDLECEFGQIECALNRGELRVTTEPIELEGVNLGPFDICLNWKRSDAGRPYQVIAREPNPACSNSSVPHPHVQHEVLCEGEGQAAIQDALEEGRLFDLFLLVSRVLATYSPDSAYAQLDTWNGLPCTDCGASIHEDDRSYCSSCDETVCDHCVSCCDSCGRGLCSGCTSNCGDCQQPSCRSCLQVCSGCQADICRQCLGNQLCHNCHQDQSHEGRQNRSEEERSSSVACNTTSPGAPL